MELKNFLEYLQQMEKSQATIEKYMRDVKHFFRFLGEEKLNILGEEMVNKDRVIEYKQYLMRTYAVSSVNSMLVALNGYLRFIGKEECRVKLLKMQRQVFGSEEKELSKKEYKRLVRAAAHTRLFYIMQTICSTGIRVSELQYITVEAVSLGKAIVNCKNKTRVIFIPPSLRKLLKKYIKKNGIKKGSIFVTKNGKVVHRSNIWRDMKKLCQKAGVSSQKVFPHNLRHLFARSFYWVEKDIIRLADVLGHSSINTTRIYTREIGYKYATKLEQMHLVLQI